MLEECGLDYELHPLNITKGEQFSPEFALISPNRRMPAIVDREFGQSPVPVFESGTILLYLAEKTGRFAPGDPLGRKEMLEWLFWQVGNQGPMAGQLSHFVNYAPTGQEYGKQRYGNEYQRCLGVLERRLQDREYILETYSVADMLAWPWVLIAKPLGQSLASFPNLRRWRAAIKERPAVRRAVDLGKQFRRSEPPTEEERKVLFGQTARTHERFES